ncbi:MAG: hypothetical protein LIO90_10160 [Bacteroidales bacterium]|nr:hypothetical protein [Bacteroidales bacterium]
MKQSEITFSRYINGPGVAWLLILGAIALGAWGFMWGMGQPLSGDRGLWLPSPNLWIADPLTSMVVNAIGLCVVILLMLWLNSTYSLMRSHSRLFVGLFALMEVATPLSTLQFGGGTLLALVVLIDLAIFYSCYLEPRNTRRTFLAFFLLSAGALCQYAFVPYVAVFLVGLAQMRAFTLKMLLAALLGCITPLWIGAGLGLIDLTIVRLPQYDDILGRLTQLRALPWIICTVVSLAVGIATGLSNLVTVYRYNARARAFNGLLMGVSILTGLLCIIDMANLTAYITLLNCCVAFQIGMFIRIHMQQRAYILSLSLIVIYTSIAIWSILMPLLA